MLPMAGANLFCLVHEELMSGNVVLNSMEPLVLSRNGKIFQKKTRLDYRRRGIGAAQLDVSAIFGTSPFGQPGICTHDKLNIASVEDDEGQLGCHGNKRHLLGLW